MSLFVVPKSCMCTLTVCCFCLEVFWQFVYQIILDFSSFQVNALLSSLDIDNDIRARGPVPGRYPELEEYWNESQSMKPLSGGADGWASEFAQQRVPHDDPNMWAQSFERQHGANGWASEFEHVRKCLFLYFQLLILFGLADYNHYTQWLQ